MHVHNAQIHSPTFSHTTYICALHAHLYTYIHVLSHCDALIHTPMKPHVHIYITYIHTHTHKRIQNMSCLRTFTNSIKLVETVSLHIVNKQNDFVTTDSFYLLTMHRPSRHPFLKNFVRFIRITTPCEHILPIF